LAYRIQSKVMAGIVGSPYFDNYLYSEKLPFPYSSFHYDLIVMHYWEWTLEEIRNHPLMIFHELQEFKICSGRELAADRLSL
jgi:hypothetical protein